MNKRVVITGIGAVTPLGNCAVSFWNGLKNGVNGIKPIKAYDTSNMKVTLAAEVEINEEDYFSAAELRKMDRFTTLAMIAAKEAFEQSGINGENADLTRCSVIVASGVGGLATIAREHGKGLEKGFDRVSPMFIPMSISNMAAGRISIMTGFKGYSMSSVTACAGGTNAIGDAMRLIRHGYADAILAGGAEGCIIPLAIGGFTAMRAVHEGNDANSASTPFDINRSGFVMGEGAGILMLEELEHAKKRGAAIYAEVTGYGTSCDAYHMTAPEPDGKGAAEAMKSAMEDANLSPENIEYINAHGTSTPLNDKGETMAIKAVLGEEIARKVAISSTKSMTGHLLGAAGAVEAIACVFAINNEFIPPTINYKNPDPECDLDYVPNVGREKRINHAMSNSLGFGGHNATLIISRYHE